MKNYLNHPQSVTSRVENLLGYLFSPNLVGKAVVLVSVSLLALSVFAPQFLLVLAPASSGVGQNTMVAFASLGVVLQAESHNRRLLGQVFVGIAFALAGTTLVQLAIGFYPADGWFRALLNTAEVFSGRPGRMSWITACTLLLLCISHASRLWSSRYNLVFSSVFTAVAAYLSTISFTLNLIGFDLASLLGSSLGTPSCVTGTLLLLVSISSSRAILSSQAYQSWETAHPGEGVFLRVTALLSMLLVATIVVAAGFAFEGLWGFALVALLLMTAIGFLVIHHHIVSVVGVIVTTQNWLRERELLLAHALTQAKLGSWRLMLPEGELEWSMECYRIFGMDHTKPVALNKVVEKIHHEDRASVQAAWKSAMSGEVMEIEHRICVGDEVRWVHQRVGFRWENDRSRCVCLGVVQDMSAARREELEQQKSRERLRMSAAQNELIREQERANIARELHDELGQRLTALRLRLDMLQRRFGGMDAKLRSELDSANNGVRELMELSRQVVSNLRPPALDAGLHAAAVWLLGTCLDRSGIKYQVTSNVDDDQLEEPLKIVVFRALQESVTNVLKHANASEVVVDLQQLNGQLVIKIADNGIGFSLADVDHSVQFGLAGMRERASILDGVVLVDSQKGVGTTITVVIPVNTMLLCGEA